MKRSVIALSAMLAVAGCDGRYYVVGSHVYQLNVADQVYKRQDGSWKTIDADDKFIARLKSGTIPAFTSEYRAFDYLERQQEQRNRGTASPKHSDPTTPGGTTKKKEKDNNVGD